MNLSHAEASLLLYLETCMVDNRGRVDQLRLNDEDRATIDLWNGSGFISFGRIVAKDVSPRGSSWVTLSDEAWLLAHEHRRARAERGQKNRGYQTTDEKHREKAVSQ